LEDGAAEDGAESFLQSRFWGGFKGRFGWKPFRFSVVWETDDGAAGNAPLLVLYRRLGPGAGFAYVPWGPELPRPYNAAVLPEALSSERAQALEDLAARLRAFLPKDTAFVRFDLPWQGDGEVLAVRALSRWPAASFRSAAVTVQPPDTVIVDLGEEEEEILARMKNKWRYNTGLAERKGVTVRRYTAADLLEGGGAAALESYYRLYEETAARDRIGIHGGGYYRALFEEAAKTAQDAVPVDIRLYLASHGGEDIAGIVTLFRGAEAVYLYGASANHKRNLMAPYALQWRAMRDAKAAGCRYYDLFGIPPRPPEEEPDHPMAGLYRFKTGFGGRIVRRPGCRDYVYRPPAAALYFAAEKARKIIRGWNKRRRRERGGSGDG
jgi:lipid II:glycine glycyltransferase (peptidoglycan interpeptide bridge formation enzyme)